MDFGLSPLLTIGSGFESGAYLTSKMDQCNVPFVHFGQSMFRLRDAEQGILEMAHLFEEHLGHVGQVAIAALSCSESCHSEFQL
jgi:hypothetical protein